MPTIAPLSASRLHATIDPARIPWETSKDIPLPRNGRQNPFQPRAMQALDLALQIKNQGYNVYLSGEADLGRSHMLLSYLGPQAKKLPTPNDLVYVHNFSDPDRPHLFALPAGMGKKFKQNLKELVELIRVELPRRFEASTFVKRRAKLVDNFQNARMGLLRKMNSVAVGKGFNLDMDESGGLTLHPLVEGKRLSEEEFDKLDTNLRLSLKSQGDNLVQAMSGFMRQLNFKFLLSRCGAGFQTLQLLKGVRVILLNLWRNIHLLMQALFSLVDTHAGNFHRLFPAQAIFGQTFRSLIPLCQLSFQLHQTCLQLTTGFAPMADFSFQASNLGIGCIHLTLRLMQIITGSKMSFTHSLSLGLNFPQLSGLGL